MADFPWSELDLDGPADERAIRRAYAARLKIVRPDLDAAGFQRLVQARDAALRAIEHTALRLLQRQTKPSDPAPQREAAAPESRAPQPDSADTPAPRKRAPPYIIDLGPSNSTADTDQPDNKPPVEMPPPLEIELAAGSASSPAARQPPVSQPRPVTADVDPPQSPPTVTEPGATSPSIRPAVDDQARAVAGPDTVSMMLSAFVEAWSQNRLLPPVAPILNLLGEQSIVARQKLEIEALRAVASLLDPNLFNRKMATGRPLAVRSLILGLDDDYAWTSNDRRLHQMMPQAAADQIGRLLRVMREWERTGQAPNFAPPGRGKTRKENPAHWVLAGAGLLLFAIIRGTSTLTPHYTAPPVPISIPYTPAAEQNQNSAAVFFNQGVAYDNQNQFDSAIQMYDAAIRLYPNYALAFYNRGLDYASKGEFDRAIHDYDQAFRLNPGDPNNLVSRGVAYNGKGLYDRAIQDYDQAIRLRPDYALAFVDRGIAYADKGEFDRAIQDYDQAILIDPNDPDAWHNRGLAKQAKGDAAGAAADLAKAR